MPAEQLRARMSIVPDVPEAIPRLIHERILAARDDKIAALIEENRRLRATIAAHHVRTF